MIIDATIDLLHRLGYEATSTHKVVQLAKVSRGALLHQFPTKVDLMIAVADRLLEEDLDRYQDALAGLAAWEDRLSALIDTAWRAFTRPDHQAFLEIWMATRADVSLSTQFAPFVARARARTDQGFQALMMDTGLPPAVLLTLGQSLVGTLRGLALESMLGGHAARLDAAVEALKRQASLFVKDAQAI